MHLSKEGIKTALVTRQPPVERIILDLSMTRTIEKRAWMVDSLPYPKCGRMTIMGYMFFDENDNHQHTYYVCTFWSSQWINKARFEIMPRCGWEGWAVPGWNGKDD